MIAWLAYAVQTQLEIALSEADLQKSLNQQLMDRKQAMEWQLLAALSTKSGLSAAAFSNDPPAAFDEDSVPSHPMHAGTQARQAHLGTYDQSL